MPKKIIAAIVLAVAALVATDGFYVISETNQAIVLRFGEFRRASQEPGLHFKVPFIEALQRYDRRILEVDPPVQQVIMADQRRLDVNSFARYRIIDPLRFYQTVSTEQVVSARLSTITNAAMRRVLGNVTQPEILSITRNEIIANIKAIVARESEQFGVEIIDVRIGRADVPAATVQAVYSRMRAEREREANEFRAQGRELAQQIRSQADRERTVLIAEAERDAQALRGEGEAEVTRILAQAFQRDEEFYAFYRSLQAYRQTFGTEPGNKFVLTPESEFFDYFENNVTP
ncbi:MAG: protease modulator HflC [Pseudomonadota bacterium]